MSRRGYDSSEIYEERDYYASRDRGRHTVYDDEIETRERRRVPERELDFLRDDYGRREAGTLVLRDENRERSRERPRRKEPGVDEVIIARGPREKEKIRDTEYVQDEVIVARVSPRERERPQERDFVKREEVDREVTYRPRGAPVATEREEFVYRRAEPAPLPRQQVRQEREEYVFRAPVVREPSPAKTEISVRERETERPRETGRREEIIIRRDEKERERPREPEYRDEEIIIRRDEKERERPRDIGYRDDEIIIKRDERSRGPPRERERDFEREEIIISDRDRRRPRAASYERESLTVTSGERERPRARSRGDFREEEQIIVRRDEGRTRAVSRGGFREDEEILVRHDEGRSRAGSRGGFREEDLIIRRGERERERPRERPREESRERNYDDIIFRHDEYKGRHEDQIVIRRWEKSPSPEPEPEPEPVRVREPEPVRDLGPVRAPPIVQEIITHHRHIDHGFERAPEPPRARTPPRPKSPSPAPVRDERIEIRQRQAKSTTILGTRNGRHYDDDIVFQRDAPRARTPPRPRSPSPAPVRDERIEIHQSGSRNGQRYDEDIVFQRDAPRTKTPPRPRSPSPAPVRDERIEIRQSGSRNGQHYDEDIVFERETGGRRALDGVRRSERREEEEIRDLAIIDNRDKGRRFEAQKSKKDRMWTEITKDLVSEEAIKEVGYEFEETEEFYYVMEYLRYEDVLRLVELTEDIRRDRRERIREIQAEREYVERPRRPLALPPVAPPWDEERVVEREVIYDRGPPPPRRYR